jgi:hypothetical protein
MNSPTTLVMEIKVNTNPHRLRSLLQDLVESGEVCEYHTLTENGRPLRAGYHRQDLINVAKVIADAYKNGD